MIPSLAREQFLDLPWGPTELDAAAEFWLKLYESAARRQSWNSAPLHQLEIRLGGFPRARTDQLAALLVARAGASDFGPPALSRIDADTLSVRSPSFDGGDAPPVGLGLPVLSDIEFDGLVVEFRYTAREPRGRGAGTLVLAGELQSGSFLLKSARRDGLADWDAKYASFTPWRSESEFFKALDEFKSTEAVPVRLARTLFPPRSADRIGGAALSLIHVPLGKPRLAGLLWRSVFLTAAVAMLGIGGYWLWEAGRLLMLAPLAFLMIIHSWLLILFVWIESRVWSVGHAQLRALYAEFDQESPGLIPLTSAESARAGSDPFLRKYTADLAAAGFVLLGDARLVPASVGAVFFRVFGAPDGTTYLAIVQQSSNTLEGGKELRFWPAFASFVCHTFLRGGGYAASMNGPRHGYRRKRSGPECLVRVFPEEEDPAVFARRHAEAVARFAEQTGDQPLRTARFEEYTRHLNALSDEERRLYADSPYTLGDHLHWYLQILRREYRG